ncbi:MAG: hypothetical protein J7502_03175 [Flavisolibacter sp.]|nr:hypothetical protein [Flavisolibacter sp.]
MANTFVIEYRHVQISADKNDVIPLLFTDYPYSHSLAMVLVWSALFFVVYWLFRRDVRSALILGLSFIYLIFHCIRAILHWLVWNCGDHHLQQQSLKD